VPYSVSAYFPSLAYSYFTCGASNTFDAWFGTEGDGSHSLTDLVALMSTYTKAISDTLEENFAEAQSVRAPSRRAGPALSRASIAP
jgi:hypothetical protein